MNDGKTTYSQTRAETAAGQVTGEVSQDRQQDGQSARLFTILDQQIPIQQYEGGRYEVKVFGNFTQLKNQDGTSSVLEDSRLLMKRGEFIPVSAEMDYLNGRVDQVLVDAINGGNGSARYLSVLEKNQRIEDYYEQIQWPEELSNAGIQEISSTLDTNDTVLMVRYTDNTVAAFNYVTGSLLFKDETEKETLSFKDYIGNWFTETWSNLWGPDTVKYDEIKVMEQELKKKPLDALLKGTEAGNGENFSSGDNVMGNVNAHGSGKTEAGADQTTGASALENYRRPGEAGKYGAAGGQNPAAAGTVSSTVPGGTIGTISGESGGQGAESSQGAGAGQSASGSQSAGGAGQGAGSIGEGAGSSQGAGTSSAAGTAGRDGDGASGGDGVTGVGASSGAEGASGAGVSGGDGVTGVGGSYGAEGASGAGVSDGDGVTGAGDSSGAEGAPGDGVSGADDGSEAGTDGLSGAGEDADGEEPEASGSRSSEDGSKAGHESAEDGSSDGELSEDGQSEEDGASGEAEDAETAGKSGAESGDGREGENGQETGADDGEERSQSAATASGGDPGGDTGAGGAGTESATGAGATGMSAGGNAGGGGAEYAQAAGTGKGSIPQVSLTPYVPVYDPETGTYQLYDTKEYFNQNYTAEPLMSVTQKLENVGITGMGSSRGLFGNQTGVAGYVVTVTGALLAALLLLRCAVNRIVKR